MSAALRVARNGFAFRAYFLTSAGTELAKEAAADLRLAKLEQEMIEARHIERHGLDARQSIIVQPHGGGPILMIHNPGIPGEAKIEQRRPDTA